MFVLNSDITIGKFRFSGVNEVVIRRSMHSIMETAVISIPSIARVVTKGQASAENIITGKQFIDGDPVIIKLGYNGDLQTEFRGFVKQRNLNMPLEIECEGYSWLLRKNKIKKFYKAVGIKELLAVAVSGLENSYTIKVQCDVDFEIGNVNLDNLCGFDIINSISKYSDGALSCFFIQPDILWCGLVYTPFVNGQDIFGSGSVSYRLGFNVVKENTLRERDSVNDPVEVRYSKKLANGDKIAQASDVFKNANCIRSKILNQVKDAQTLKKFANEKAYQLNYSGYEGHLNAFLQPYASPGFTASITDSRYPEKNGTYLVEGTQIYFGIAGARRKVEIGPKLGSAKE